MKNQQAIIPALLLSLIIHGMAFAVAYHIQNQPVDHFTRTEITPDPAGPLDDEQEEPDEPERKLGIEESDFATVTWIGYNEYEQHLARLAQVEQAEMTLDETVPSIPVQSDMPTPSEQAAQPPIDQSETVADASPPTPPDETDTILLPHNDDQTITPPAPSLVSTNPQAEIRPDSHSPLPPADSITDKEPIQPFFSPSLFFSSPFFLPPSLSEHQPEPNDTPPPKPADAPQEDRTPTDQPQESQPAPPSAEPGDKDSTPTSVEPIPDIPWNSGKPIAAEGIEVHPYALYRHVVVDSNDRLFILHWNGRVRHNPIATIQFNHSGKARQVTILKKTGYAPLDNDYLISWLSRWTASGKAIDELAPNQLSDPFLFKIIFVTEKTDRP